MRTVIAAARGQNAADTVAAMQLHGLLPDVLHTSVQKRAIRTEVFRGQTSPAAWYPTEPRYQQPETGPVQIVGERGERFMLVGAQARPRERAGRREPLAVVGGHAEGLLRPDALLGLLGEPGVNVLELNVALDQSS